MRQFGHLIPFDARRTAHPSFGFRVGRSTTVWPTALGDLRKLKPDQWPATMTQDCLFCSIVAGSEPASVVYQDEHTMAFVDPRQFHPGHLLVIPNAHVHDIRLLPAVDAGPLMVLLVAAARSVDAAFPADGLSIWHSAGRGANQEIPHLHVHVHPRVAGDDLLRVYPSPPTEPDRGVLDARAATIRPLLEKAMRGV